MFSIVKRKNFSGFTFLLEVNHPRLAKAVKPGQSVTVIPHADGDT